MGACEKNAIVPDYKGFGGETKGRVKEGNTLYGYT